MTEPRREVISIRVTKEQKRRLQRLAKRKGESVSTLILRAAESAAMLPPREKPREDTGGTIRIVIGTPEGPESERPEVYGNPDAFELDERASKYGE